MPEFHDSQSALEAARAAAHKLSRELFSEKQRLAALERKARQASRFGPDMDPTLQDRLAGAQERVEGLEAQLDDARARETLGFGTFADFTDPREHIGNLSANTPILLFPLRLETRFRRLGDSEDGELLVRAYPDDAMVDAFEDTLTESEVQRTRAYWTNQWIAGGDEAGARGAWKTLVAAQGSGRAFWLTETYRPLNAGDAPERDPNVPTVILVIPTDDVLVDPEHTAVLTFWEALWRAGEDTGAQAAALSALVAAVGEDRASALQRSHMPANLDEPPPAGATRQNTTVMVRFIEFPGPEDTPMREAGWSQAPQVNIMPDRLLLLAYVGEELTLQRLGNPIPTPLVIGPDPSAEEGQQLRPDGDDLAFGDDMTWVVDFDRALEVGMGFRVVLDPIAFRRGFDKLMVIGVRLRSDAETSAVQLEALFAHQHQSPDGLSLLPQGQPTNNVEDDQSAYSWREDSDVSFNHYFGEAPPDPTAWFEKRDGRWMAELLGLDPARLTTLPYYGRTDITDARAMNRALWPATIGYFMESMMHPVFDDDTIRRTRGFFNRHVLARGQIPSIRVGNQPYGILPATARSRMNWLLRRQDDVPGTSPQNNTAEDRFLRRLYTLLQAVESDLAPLVDNVAYIGKPGGFDSHQLLLDVVGLHPGSAEHHQRFAESFEQLYNRLAMMGAGGAFVAALTNAAYVQSGLGLLSRLGYQQPEDFDLPDVLEKLFLREAHKLTGPLIDDRDLSETDPIRAYTAAGENYIEWLLAAAGTSHDMLRRQEALTDDRPRALLYLMLHRALDMSFVETSLQIFLANALLSETDVAARRREPKFIHVAETELADPDAARVSRWSELYTTSVEITGDPQLTIGEFIPQNLTTMTATAYLARQLAALEHLANRPTAVLERVFSEHLDLCSYRLDAWWGGLMSRQLERMRYEADGASEAAPARGIHLGAFGWLEDVKPEFKRMDPVDLPASLSAIFERDGDAPLTTDSINQGYIHAPSLNHAVTAAILRNGYISNAQPETPEAFKINLSSERVRRALAILQGMRGGQSLNALLGYEFERGVHDRHNVEIDEFIYDLRFEFPLTGNRLKRTRAGKRDGQGNRRNARAFEARNVIDGVALVEHIRSTGNDTYPFGLDDMPGASPAQAAALSEEAERIADINDAVADLAMAESIHQVAQGNYDRAGATLDTFSKGKFPQMPDVIRTPRSGTTLNHRVALHLEAGLDPNDAANTTLRAQAEPALNRWLSSVLPDPARVACEVTLTDPLTETTDVIAVTQADLGLLPIDLLTQVDTDSRKSMTALDDRVEAHVIATQTPRPHVDLSVSYQARIAMVPDHVSFFELAALLRTLRAAILDARPLRATDMSLTLEARDSTDLDTFLNPDRVVLVRNALENGAQAVDAYRAALEAAIDAGPPEVVMDAIDLRLAEFVQIAGEVTPFAPSEVGTGGLFETRRGIFAGMLDTLGDILSRWEDKRSAFDALIADYAALPGTATDEERVALLRRAERELSSERTDPLPADPDDFRDDLVATLRPAFVGRQAAMAAEHTGSTTLSGLRGALVDAVTENAPFDAEEIDVNGPNTAILDLAATLLSRATTLSARLAAKLAAADGLIAEAVAATAETIRTEARIAALKAMLGEEAMVIPEFGLLPEQQSEWANAWGPGAQASTAILDYLTGELDNPFPVDDWLHGIARVRGKMAHLETLTILSETLSGTGLDLQPLQLPHRPNEFWLGLDFPQVDRNGDPFALEEEKLLYTGHFAQPFSPGRQCGLLLDEWTEVIPSRSEDTALTFHFDRPNSEPPQVLLLALPSDMVGGWRFDDLVDTVKETFDLARKRAIEPTQIDSTAYARFLPALYGSVTLFPITATLNFAENNGFATTLATLGENDE